MYNFYLVNKNKDFLKNNYYNIFLFKNINFYIFNNLPFIKKKKLTNLNTIKKELNIDSEFDSLFNFKNDYLTIKSVNINFSLDIFSDIFFINNIFYVLNYLNESKKVDLVFKNYSSYELIESYKKILDEIFKFRDLSNFNFDINSIKNFESENNKYQILNILKNKINNDENETKKKIFDLYLKDYKNVPESNNNIFNFIFFLRKFPLFTELMLYYFKIHDINYFNKLLEVEKLIILENDDDVNPLRDEIEFNKEKYINTYEDKTMFNPYLNFFSENKKILNLNFLLQDNFNSDNDFFLNIFNIMYDINSLKKINIEEITSEKIFNIYKDKIIKFSSTEKINNYLFSLYLSLNNFDLIQNYFKENNINKNNDLYKEEINLIINKFVFYLFFIFKYFNLQQFKNLDELYKIYNNDFNDIDWIESPSIDNQIKLETYLYHIYTAYIIFYNEGFYTFYKKIIFNLKHFFYIFKYFKNNNDKLFPLYLFLLFSDEKLKIIKKYKEEENNILIFLERIYDQKNKNPTKFLIQ